jgi:hypothetical protein
MKKHDEENESIVDEIYEHGHYPSPEEEAEELKPTKAITPPATTYPADAEGRTTLKRLVIDEHQTFKSRLDGQDYDVEFGPQDQGNVPKNPFKSAAQRGYMHAHPEVLGKAGLAEWDAASKGQHVPEHVKKKK